jgi:predicted nucleotidyltransferase
MARRKPIEIRIETPRRRAQPLKLTRSLPRNQIKLLCSEIAREFHPDKIVLFGSHAYGKPRFGSDVDLLIVMPFEGSPFRQAAAILGHVVRTVGIMPLDLLVRTGQQVQERIQMGDGFMREIIERGRVMYEADHS